MTRGEVTYKGLASTSHEKAMKSSGSWKSFKTCENVLLPTGTNVETHVMHDEHVISHKHHSITLIAIDRYISASSSLGLIHPTNPDNVLVRGHTW